LYTRAREWFAKTYKSSKSVIQMEDKESGTLVGRALLLVKDGTYGYIDYSISVYLKTGRFRYVITDFSHRGNPRYGFYEDFGPCESFMNYEEKPFFLISTIYNLGYPECIKTIKAEIPALIADLKTAMKNNAGTQTKDDW